MSSIDKSVTNGEVIPRFETNLFAGNEGSRFAIGIIAVGDEATPGFEAEHNAYLRLRANVYADQMHMIDRSHVRADGTEVDTDDSRSIHFGVYEQDGDGGARAVGAMRLIVKSEADDRPLPIEDFFQDAFGRGKAPIGSTEASRYIARHENARVQEKISGMVLARALAYIKEKDLGPVYGVVEPSLESRFSHIELPFLRIADPKYVPEYAADNLGIEIYSALFAENIERRQPGLLDKLRHHERQGRFMYFGRQVVRSAGVTPFLQSEPTLVPA